jgi:hypothetical protein
MPVINLETYQLFSNLQMFFEPPITQCSKKTDCIYFSFFKTSFILSAAVAL